MRNFTTPLPANNNVKGSGTGSPAGDMNKISNALVEIRSNVPSTTADLGAITATQLADAQARATALQARIQALKTTSISDAFTRTALGAGYTASSPAAVSLNGSTLVNDTNQNMIVNNTPVKTSFMWSQITVLADANMGSHQCVVSNYSASGHYRAGYSAASGKWELYRATTSSFWTVVGSSAVATKPTVAYTLLIRNTFGVITVLFNNTTVITYTDPTPLSGKQAGIFFPQDGAVAQRFVDNFQFGDI